MSRQAGPLVLPAGSVHPKAVRRTTYSYYGKLTMVESPGDPYLPQVTSPVGRSGAKDEQEGEGVFLSLATRVQVYLSRWRELIAGEAGAVATEYVLLLIFVAVAIVAAATLFGVALGESYKEACAPLGSSATC
jgi:Flp pilus assembly pilin Flp